jgi:hypothetical protein
MFKEALISKLKRYVTFECSSDDWNRWFQQNLSEVESALDRKYFLKLKHASFEGAKQILEHYNVEYSIPDGICSMCGGKILKVVRSITSKEEIVAFAKESTLKNKDVIIKEEWLHPGEYCSNGCYVTLHNYR